MPEYTLGLGSLKVHYGVPGKPSSVKCGNWQEYTTHLSWSDDPSLVTCKNCIKRIPNAAPQVANGAGKVVSPTTPAVAAPYEIPTLDSYFAAGDRQTQESK